MTFVEFTFMLVVDMMFLVALFMLMVPLGIWRQAAFAVMKRNFIGYFSNPTGYVFLCLFVLLTSFAAFWPHEFFTTNLANFDQLNKYLPYIMLIFIPAITMSIWAEERRQGTDELLLTLPAKDFDIVIGKYFAAVLVFTVSLLFSQLSNYAVLLSMTGGNLDNLLLFSTYLGYWFMGIAMISLGMMASFLTSNLTVGFIFGAAFNAPLAFFSNADIIFSDTKWIQRLYEWSLLQRFEPFGRGLVSASSICYFLGIVFIGVYLSLILIGRRHWLGGRDGTSLFWHYAMRAVFLVIIAISGVLVVQHTLLNRARVDISDSQISTLSPSTIKVLNELASQTDDESQSQINVEAYVSGSVPSEYVKTKYDLVNLLREFDVLGGSRVQVNLHQGMEPFSEEAILAEKKYGIRPVKVRSESRGALREEDVILGVAISSGLERIVIPFMPYGMPVEYELMRSINTVAKSTRKTIGVVQTDALVMGATITVNRQTTRIPRLRILSELEKQYNVEMVDASSKIAWIDDETGKPRYDVLFVVQPSQTTPTELDNIIDAIQSGQPTVIFEDPFPNPDNFTLVRPTFYPRALTRNGQEQARIIKLWDALDLEVDRQPTPAFTRSSPQANQLPTYFSYLIWQLESANPYKRNSQLNQKEQLIIRETDPRIEQLFSGEHSATLGVNELYFQYAGYIKPTPKSSLDFSALVNTSNAGRILLSDWLSTRSESERDGKRQSGDRQFTVVAQITGDKAAAAPGDETSKQNTNVIYVADIDILSDFFVASRNEPIINGIEYHYQNMSFVLNIVDALASEDTYLGLRNRKVDHKTLKVVEETYEKAMGEVYDLVQQARIDQQVKINQAQSEIREKLDPLRQDIEKQIKKKDAGQSYDAVKLAAQQGLLEQELREQSAKFQAKRTELENSYLEKKRQIDLKAELEIQKIQRKFKLWAALFPPIPPLLVGLFVFTRRRLREREGISKARRLK